MSEIKLKDYTEYGIKESLMSTDSIVNDYEFTDELAYDQKFEVDSQGILTGGITRTNRSTTRVEMNSVDNALNIYEDEVLRAQLTANYLAFASPSGVSSGSILGLGTEAIEIDTGGSTFEFNAADFLPGTDNSQDLGSSLQRWKTLYLMGLNIGGTAALAGTKVYYVSDTSGGAVDRKLTFKDGILVSET